MGLKKDEYWMLESDSGLSWADGLFKTRVDIVRFNKCTDGG